VFDLDVEKLEKYKKEPTKYENEIRDTEDNIENLKELIKDLDPIEALADLTDLSDELYRRSKHSNYPISAQLEKILILNAKARNKEVNKLVYDTTKRFKDFEKIRKRFIPFKFSGKLDNDIVAYIRTRPSVYTFSESLQNKEIDESIWGKRSYFFLESESKLNFQDAETHIESLNEEEFYKEFGGKNFFNSKELIELKEWNGSIACAQQHKVNHDSADEEKFGFLKKLQIEIIRYGRISVRFNHFIACFSGLYMT
jgi:hypothetical protein